MDRNSSKMYVAAITQLVSTGIIMPMRTLTNFWCLPAFSHFSKLAHYLEWAFPFTAVLICNTRSLTQHVTSTSLLSSAASRCTSLGAATLACLSSDSIVLDILIIFVTYLEGFPGYYSDMLLWWHTDAMVTASFSRVHIHAGCWRWWRQWRRQKQTGCCWYPWHTSGDNKSLSLSCDSSPQTATECTRQPPRTMQVLQSVFLQVS